MGVPCGEPTNRIRRIALSTMRLCRVSHRYKRRTSLAELGRGLRKIAVIAKLRGPVLRLVIAGLLRKPLSQGGLGRGCRAQGSLEMFRSSTAKETLHDRAGRARRLVNQLSNTSAVGHAKGRKKLLDKAARKGANRAGCSRPEVATLHRGVIRQPGKLVNP